jgi:hypothetical protein
VLPVNVIDGRGVDIIGLEGAMEVRKTNYRQIACMSVALLIVLSFASRPVTAQLGELPPGYSSRQDIGGVRVEIVLILLVDSAVAAAHVPTGLTLLTLQQIAINDTATARFLASRPHLTAAVPSVLLFSAVDSLTIDDRAPMANTAAAWWLQARSIQHIDERARGRNWVEVAFWTPDPTFVRLLRPYWPRVREAPVTITRVDGDWWLALSLPDGTIRGRCTPTGPRLPADYPLPDYSTVWSAGSEPTAFTIYTGFGHHTRDCIDEWTAEGTNSLVGAVNATLKDPPPWMATVMEDGWRARAGVYRR